MSDSLLRVFPEEVNHVPPAPNIANGLALLHQRLPQATQIRAEASDSVRFIDAGENWEGVNCPHCGADAEDWWTEAMSAAYRSNFADLRLVAPCCRAEVSLDRLRYAWPVGFAKFTYEILNPGVAGLHDEDLEHLQLAVGCKLRVVQAHV